MKLYEVLIPKRDNDNKPFSKRHHEAFTQQVRQAAGGLSVCPDVNGEWMDNGRVYKERMTPVRIATSARKIRKLAELAKEHYRQLSVMYYPVSQSVTFV